MYSLLSHHIYAAGGQHNTCSSHLIYSDKTAEQIEFFKTNLEKNKIKIKINWLILASIFNISGGIQY